MPFLLPTLHKPCMPRSLVIFFSLSKEKINTLTKPKPLSVAGENGTDSEESSIDHCLLNEAV